MCVLSASLVRYMHTRCRYINIFLPAASVNPNLGPTDRRLALNLPHSIAPGPDPAYVLVERMEENGLWRPPGAHCRNQPPRPSTSGTAPKPMNSCCSVARNAA